MNVLTTQKSRLSFETKALLHFRTKFFLSFQLILGITPLVGVLKLIMMSEKSEFK